MRARPSRLSNLHENANVSLAVKTAILASNYNFREFFNPLSLIFVNLEIQFFEIGIINSHIKLIKHLIILVLANTYNIPPSQKTLKKLFILKFHLFL